MAKKILFFNHKGGVSKTTSTFNVGWMLASLGKKVLLVDADPQCNLTAFFLAERFDEYYVQSATKDQNLMSGVRSAFEGNPTPIAPITCPTHTRNERLYLLPGHMNLSELEAQLTFALTASMTLTSLQNLPGSFNDLIDKTADKYNIDYVLIDVNPGLGSINQDLFLICDGFIIPTNPDLFCIMAINSLAKILPSWVKWKNQNIDDFKNAAYPLPNNTPKFIGTIIQRFNIRNGVAARPYQDIIADIKTTTKDVFVPALEKMEMLYANDKYNSDFCIEEIKDFAALGQKSQQFHIPVFALTDEELGHTGTVLAQSQKSRDSFKMQFQAIAQYVMNFYE